MLNFRYLTDIIKPQVQKVTKIHCMGAEYFQADGHTWKTYATSPANSQKEVHMNKMKIVIICPKVISLDNDTLFTHF